MARRPSQSPEPCQVTRRRSVLAAGHGAGDTLKLSAGRTPAVPVGGPLLQVSTCTHRPSPSSCPPMKTHAIVTDSRDRIVEAAERVFSESGYRGATTRRIAAEAGVNEVTLFRNFGSKDELIREAIASRAGRDAFPRLPERPVDPVAELTAFSRQQLDHLFRVRSLIRTCLGEGNERPEILARATERPVMVHRELLAYLGRMQEHGLAAADADIATAASTLMGALFSDAMGRDFMPQVYGSSLAEAPGRYVALIMQAVKPATEPNKRTNARLS